MADDYVEGDSTSAPADPVGAIPTDDTGRKPAIDAADTIDSASVHDAPIQRLNRTTSRTSAARKAFAEAVLANKANPVKVNEDLEDPEDVALAAADPVAAAKVEIAAAAAKDSPPPPVAPVVPPAPSLDPEVLRLRQQAKAELEAIQARKPETPPPPAADISSYEDYLDNQPRAYRNWLETMRGEKFATDDEFKREAGDFITQMSAEVMGVPLPKDVRSELDSALAKKMVRTNRTIQAKREAAAKEQAEKERAESAAKAESERVEQEWTKAASALDRHIATEAAKDYPWLAAEDSPGKIVVDVIRHALEKDGTNLSWQEASKKANDFLAAHWKPQYDKRKAALGVAADPKPAVVAAKPATPAAPVAPAAPTAPPAAPPAPKKWSRDSHMEQTRAAFRAALNTKET